MLDVPPENVLRKGRLQPGKLFLVDIAEGRIVDDEEVKARGRHAAAVRRVVPRRRRAARRPARAPRRDAPREPLRTRQLAFGYTQEDLRVLLAPMAAKGEEPIGSMGNDTPLAVLSDQAAAALLLLQAAVRAGHQPADRPDPRERGDVAPRRRRARRATCSTRRRSTRHQLVIPHPILSNARARVAARRRPVGVPLAHAAAHLAGRRRRRRAGARACERLCEQAAEAVAEGANILVLSDRGVGAERAPIPSLLAVAAVHHHLVREGMRMQAGLVLETGEAREVHHFASLIGYGAPR